MSIWKRAQKLVRKSIPNMPNCIFSMWAAGNPPETQNNYTQFNTFGTLLLFSYFLSTSHVIISHSCAIICHFFFLFIFLFFTSQLYIYKTRDSDINVQWTCKENRAVLSSHTAVQKSQSLVIFLLFFTAILFIAIVHI
jgi:hypothetical protein